MLGTRGIYWTVALVTGAAAAASCGGDDTTPATDAQGPATSVSSSSAGGGGAGGSGGAGGAGAGWVCPPGEGTTLALTKLSFGEGNSGEWKKVGLDIDGLESTASSTDVCQPNSGANPSTPYPDGENGIDNSFGKNLLPLIIGFYPKWPDDVNNFLDIGNFNAMLRLYCLPPTGDAEIITKLFGGTKLGSDPKYDGTDKWPVAPELLGDPKDPESSTITFEKSTVTADIYDSGKDQKVILTIPMEYKNPNTGMTNSTAVKLTLYGARVTMTLSADRKSATKGMIGGALNTEEFIDQVKKIGWMLDLCTEMLYPQVIQQVRQASDIMSDGSQDPTKTCDAISIGIGFEMKEVQIGDVGPPADVGAACP